MATMRWRVGTMLLRRGGMTWSLRAKCGKIRSFSARLTALAIAMVLGYALVFALVCSVAQVERASVPVVVEISNVVVCESSIPFKAGMLSAMIPYVLSLWFFLALLKNKELVPSFCSTEYRRMLAILTVMFVLTLSINLLGMTRYWWGRLIYINMVLALYGVGYYCLCGRTVRDFVLRRHDADDKIISQVYDFIIPTTFRDMLASELQRNFLFNMFSKWMRHIAQPVYLGQEMNIGLPAPLVPENWVPSRFSPLIGTPAPVAETKHLIFPHKLILLFESIAIYQKPLDAIGLDTHQQDPDEIPAMFDALDEFLGLHDNLPGQEYAIIPGSNAADHLSAVHQQLDRERYGNWFVRALYRMEARLANIKCSMRLCGRSSRNTRYSNPGSTRKSMASMIIMNFIKNTCTQATKQAMLHNIALHPTDAAALKDAAARLPVVASTDEWYNANCSMEIDQAEVPPFFAELHCYLMHILDYYYSLFIAQGPVVSQFTQLSRVQDALVANSDGLIDPADTEDPYGAENDGGLIPISATEPPADFAGASRRADKAPYDRNHDTDLEMIYVTSFTDD